MTNLTADSGVREDGAAWWGSRAVNSRSGSRGRYTVMNFFYEADEHKLVASTRW